MSTVLIPLPATDFDPTEVAVSWQVLTAAGHRVVFATPTGAPGQPDELMVTGRGLDVWSLIPGLDRLVGVGRVLRAGPDARAALSAMRQSTEFSAPLRWEEVVLEHMDGLLLPGGHRAAGMRPYLESSVLQALVVDAFARGLQVAAVCHGVLLAARAIDPATGRSVLFGRKTTALTWALERRAWHLARLTRFWDRDYYRTYTEAPGQSEGWMSVQAEVTRALADPADFLDVPADAQHRRAQTSGTARDTLTDARAAFVVIDRNYTSARWPGDMHTFATTFARQLDAVPQPAPPQAEPAP